jgi:uncharacterized OsmC-like protein
VVGSAKRFEYAVSLRRDGSVLVGGGSALAPDDAWSPEHLVLAALARCTLKSLRHYARDMAVSGSAEASGLVTQREEDGRFALVQAEVAFDVELDRSLAPAELRGLLARAERGCFVGNSLRATPRYSWRVNGEVVEAGPGEDE